MIETLRIINNIDKLNSNKIFPQNENTTRGHKHKIYKKECRTNTVLENTASRKE
jgi:hypothetical protein